MSETQGPVYSSAAAGQVPDASPELTIQFLAKNDVSCPTCGYALRGSAKTQCPECGEQIRLAVRGDSMRFILSALRYLLWALLINAAILCLWSVGMGIYYSTRNLPGFPTTGFIARLIISSLLELSIAVICVVFIRRLQKAQSRHAYRGLEQLALWIALLLLGNLLVSIMVGFF